MANSNVVVDELTFDGSSSAKQRLLEQYARGEISLEEVAVQVAEIHPIGPPRSWRMRVATVCMAVIAAFFMPAAVHRE